MANIYTEDFETDGNGTRYTTSNTEFSDGSGDYFIRTDGSDIGGFVVLAGPGGSAFFAAQDTDGEPEGGTALSVSVTGIDITGITNLGFSGLFAEDDSTDGNEDWDANARVYIEVQIDGGGYVKVLQFAGQGATNTEPLLDTDLDGVGDGTPLSATFASFSAGIAGTGSLLDFRVVIENLDAGDEDIAFDDLTITGDAPSVPVDALDETFDDASKFTTSAAFFSDGASDYFGISDFGGSAPSGLKAYTGATGTFLTGQDLDGEGASVPIVADWVGIDISGLSNLRFSGDFAEFFDSPGDIDGPDFLRVSAQIDGGGYVSVLEFRGADFSSTSGAFNGNFRQDTDFDGTGDGAQLTDAFQNFIAAISGSGSTLDLRFEASVDSGDEDFGVDNFKITGDSGGTVVPAVLVRAGDGIAVDEAGTLTDTFTVALSTTPSDAVTVSVAAPDGQTEVSADGVVFAASVDVVLSDTTEATVTVRAVDDAVDEATVHSGAIDFTVTSSDAAFDGLAVSSLGAQVSDNDFTVSKIHTIQGNGAASSLVGQEVTVEAVVTGILTNSSGQTGYFLQEEDADWDADATTSEGIFVFSSTPVAVGDVLRVTADVAEFSNLTELTNVISTEVLATGQTLPTTTQITIGMSADFEAYEGMRVELVSGSTNPLTVITNFNLDRFGEVRVSEGNQFQPTQLFDAQTQAAEVAALAAQNAANQLTIDDSSTAQNPSSYSLIDDGTGGPLDVGDPITDTGPTLRLGSEIQSSVVGVMDERFGGYRIQTDTPLDVDPATNAGARPTSAPDVGGDVKVASFNVLNYFTTLSGGTGPSGTVGVRGARTPEDLQRQTDKIVLALEALDADIIGLQELENNGFGAGSAIQALVDALNAKLGGAVYAVADPGVAFAGTDAITTGIIYKPGAVTLVGADTFTFAESSAATTFAAADAIQQVLGSSQVSDLQRSRPATAATFTDANGNELTIAVNHFKSKGSSGLEALLSAAQSGGVAQSLIDALVADPNFDQGDGQGYWNQVRADAAAELSTWLATNPTGGTGSNSLILGDLNAYAQEDPVQTIEADGYTDLAEQFIGPDAYSFVFDGQRGTLDYGLASASLLDNITGVAEWHINADEPDLLNYNSSFNDPAFYNADFYAASDHDPLVIGLDLNDAPTTVAASLSFTEVFGIFNVANYAEDGSHVADKFILWVQREISFADAGLKITAEDGLAGSRDFVSALGEGLSVFSPRGDRGDRGDKRQIDDAETLTFSLTDSNGRGDALDVAFEFVNIDGMGQVTLEFSDDGAVVDSVAVDVVNGAVAYDLAGFADFDQVTLGVTDTLELAISEVTFNRIDDPMLG